MKSAKKFPVEIKDQEIHFPKGYFFKASPVQKSRQVKAAEIRQINLNTWPPSLVRAGEEVIFVRYDQQEALKAFGQRNQIEILDRFDIWEHICEPYLDTEYSPAFAEKNKQELAKNGVPPTELEAIRKKIKRAMAANNFAWEWTYLGQYHYLSWTWFLTQKQYWWSMEIALRNFEGRGARGEV